ncbi:uncharacterized protein EDB91DRAFT_1101123 [Suillus paluster]|uniref:uncharacterized protein n=1 Tax=Suillus paluster TaxID=48578 RepID=UPI001B86C777|nr:uncharacterized protein EDB91DRAFT_1101123 [Suillus paluster]KAG1754009.1 hypothetical protein EDB91DRAFT_1101123 [Suillus paluster]
MLSGDEYLDTVPLSFSLVIPSQLIGVAGQIAGLRILDVDRFLGLGPTGLSAAAVSNGGEASTVVDNLYSQSLLSYEAI